MDYPNDREVLETVHCAEPVSFRFAYLTGDSCAHYDQANVQLPRGTYRTSTAGSAELEQDITAHRQ